MPAEARARFVASQPGMDPAVLAEVARALAEADRDDEFLRPGTALQSPLFDSLAEGPDPDEPRPAMANGTRIGRYVVAGFLGAGGMGEVYRARDTRLARDVALKVLPAHVRLEPDRAARLRREARALAALNHPHVAALYDLEESEDVLALVLEFVRGETLAARLGRGALPMPEAFAIARQVAEGMAAAHARGIVHCDLKPGNVAFDRDGRVRILDFGIATVVRGVADVSASQVPVLTTTPGMGGGRIGTARYMSPEQLRGEDVDPRADVWAFGCLCFELVTGAFAFDGASSADTMVRVLAGNVPLDRLPADTPPAWRTLVERCLATSAVARLQRDA